MTRQTYTYATLAISPAAFEEIKRRLMEVGHDQALRLDADDAPLIDMHGLALVPERAERCETQSAVMHATMQRAAHGVGLPLLDGVKREAEKHGDEIAEALNESIRAVGLVGRLPCKHCGGDPYDRRHIPGQGKTHEYEPVLDQRVGVAGVGVVNVDESKIEQTPTGTKHVVSGHARIAPAMRSKIFNELQTAERRDAPVWLRFILWGILSLLVAAACVGAAAAIFHAWGGQ